MNPLSYDIEINLNISVEFNVGPPYWMRELAVYLAGIQQT